VAVSRRRRAILNARTSAALRKEALSAEDAATFWQERAGDARKETNDWAYKAGAWTAVAEKMHSEAEKLARRRKDRQRIAELWERLTAGL